jgi:hypothetical protein
MAYTEQSTFLLFLKMSEEIASLAYELYLSRSGEAGHAVDDWLRAEREITTYLP